MHLGHLARQEGRLEGRRTAGCKEVRVACLDGVQKSTRTWRGWSCRPRRSPTWTPGSAPRSWCRTCPTCPWWSPSHLRRARWWTTARGARAATRARRRRPAASLRASSLPGTGPSSGCSPSSTPCAARKTRCLKVGMTRACHAAVLGGEAARMRAPGPTALHPNPLCPPFPDSAGSYLWELIYPRDPKDNTHIKPPSGKYRVRLFIMVRTCPAGGAQQGSQLLAYSACAELVSSSQPLPRLSPPTRARRTRGAPW